MGRELARGGWADPSPWVGYFSEVTENIQEERTEAFLGKFLAPNPTLALTHAWGGLIRLHG